MFTFTLALTAAASAAPTPVQVEQAAMRVASKIDGVLRDCPAGYAKVGTRDKKCVGASLTVEQVRSKLSATLGNTLQGVWRSRDSQRSVYNWLETPGGYVYLRLQADPDGRAQTLVYIDTPPNSAPSGTTSSSAPAPKVTVNRAEPARVIIVRPEPAKPAAPKAAGSKPAAPQTSAPRPSGSAPAATTAAANPAQGVAPVPFTRVLQLQARRMSGPDIRAAQNRLIQLTEDSSGGQGDGWYGPVTAATVRSFQAANDLPVTGRIDQTTWTALFSPDARTFVAPSIP